MSYIRDVFGSRGILARHFAAYEMRPGQIDLATAIDAAFTDGVELLAEGPTGTGKAIAYSVPAVFHTSQHGRRVLIVTANIALQEQLFYKDLPLLAELLPWKFTYELIKGKGNYLCRDRLSEELMADHDFLFLMSDEGERHMNILKWAEHTVTGDVSELDFQPEHTLWSRFSASGQRCNAGICHYRDNCFAYSARERAESADIVVTNYHMLLVHLLVREATSMDMILPPFDLLICDEGHSAPDIARDVFGYCIMPRNIRWIAKRLTGIGEPALGSQLMLEAEKFFASLCAYRESTEYRARIRRPHPVDSATLVGLLARAEAASKHAMITCLDTESRIAIRKMYQRASIVGQHIAEAISLANESLIAFIDERH